MMKKRGWILILVVVAAAIWATIPALGQEKPKPEISIKEGAGLTIARLVVGTGVENREPTGAAETFPASTEKVYCFLEAKDIGKDTEITLTWFHGEKETWKISLPVKMGPKWRTWAYKSLRGLKGDWKVEVKDAEGKTLKDTKFKVE